MHNTNCSIPLKCAIASRNCLRDLHDWISSFIDCMLVSWDKYPELLSRLQKLLRFSYSLSNSYDVRKFL
jgi:hypothetical protein